LSAFEFIIVQSGASMHQQILQTEAGASLALRVYEPSSGAHTSVVIGGAMGVAQAYYADFAAWLAHQGFRVTTFDYRGSGESRQGRPGRSLRGFKADLLDWAQDYEAVIASAKSALPDAPLYLLGHSLGAQLPGFLTQPQRVDGLMSIAAGSGYWRDNAPQLRRMILYFWFVLVPVATRLFGYFPGRKLRKVGDLPAGVMMQWRKWCLHPRYSVGAEGESARLSYARVRFPVVALSLSDDELMTPRGTQTLIDFYANAPRTIECIRPVDVQARRIGHFGFFRAQFADTLWPRVLSTLNGMRTAQPVAAATS
jgi:predicted alpha/beta hydrolase